MTAWEVGGVLGVGGVETADLEIKICDELVVAGAGADDGMVAGR